MKKYQAAKNLYPNSRVKFIATKKINGKWTLQICFAFFNTFKCLFFVILYENPAMGGG